MCNRIRDSRRLLDSPQTLNKELALKLAQHLEAIVQAHVQSNWLVIQPIPDLASRYRAFSQQFDSASALAA